MKNTLSPELVFTIDEIRALGYGTNFNVLNPADGFRKDGRLWFGTCDQCGESVTNSSLKGVWEHSEKTGRSSWRSINYCPTGF